MQTVIKETNIYVHTVNEWTGRMITLKLNHLVTEKNPEIRFKY